MKEHLKELDNKLSEFKGSLKTIASLSDNLKEESVKYIRQNEYISIENIYKYEEMFKVIGKMCDELEKKLTYRLDI